MNGPTFMRIVLWSFIGIAGATTAAGGYLAYNAIKESGYNKAKQEFQQAGCTCPKDEFVKTAKPPITPATVVHEAVDALGNIKPKF